METDFEYIYCAENTLEVVCLQCSQLVCHVVNAVPSDQMANRHDMLATL